MDEFKLSAPDDKNQELMQIEQKVSEKSIPSGNPKKRFTQLNISTGDNPLKKQRS